MNYIDIMDINVLFFKESPVFLLKTGVFLQETCAVLKSVILKKKRLKKHTKKKLKGGEIKISPS